MRKLVLLFIVLSFCQLQLFSQTLSVQETISYINERLKDDEALAKYNQYEQIEITSDGYIIKNTFSTDPYGKTHLYHSSKVYALDLNNQAEVDNSQFATTFGGVAVNIQCVSSSCVSSKNHTTGEVRGYDKLTFYMTTTRNAERLSNALNYIISLAKETANNLEEYDQDPFSNKSVRASQVTVSNQAPVPLRRSNGVFFVNVEICGNTQPFTFDSGASDVLISTSIEQCLIQKGKISRSDYLVPALYEIADGTIVEYRRVQIPELSIGGFTIKNVIACVGPSPSNLLLGKSFLDKFSSWTIDNDNSNLILTP